MNERSPTLTVEGALYAALFAGALALRLARLGAQPLTDEEARQALIALAAVRGGAAALPASPAYFAFTYLHFFLFGASEAVARLAPALAGAGLALTPSLFRGVLGRGGALAASALLALATTLVAASRSADGAILAVFGLALGAGALWRLAETGARRWLVVGALGLSVAIASGGVFLHGILALVVTLLILRLTQPESVVALRGALAPLAALWRALAIAVVVALLLIITLAGLYLNGLGALVASWTAWLGGFGPGAAGRNPQLLPVFLISYDPLLLVFGAVGAWLAARRGHRQAQGLAWFSLASFALAVFYPGRELLDLVWPAASLAVLAGWALSALVADAWAREEWPLAAMQVGIGFVLAMFALLNVAAYAEVTRGGRLAAPMLVTTFLGRSITIAAEAQLAVAGLALALVLLVAYLFAMGWSERASRLGLVLTGVAVLLPATLAAGWGVTQSRAAQAGELWWPKPASTDIWRLMTTLGQVSNSSVGNTTDIEVTVQASDTGVLRWLLRDFPNAVFVDRLGPEMISPVVITPVNEENPTLGSSYVGQDFDLNSAWVAPESLADWVSWAAYRRTRAVQAEPVILWVRQDVQQLTSTGNQ
jgi:hypothetical protein